MFLPGQMIQIETTCNGHLLGLDDRGQVWRHYAEYYPARGGVQPAEWVRLPGDDRKVEKHTSPRARRGSLDV